MRFFIILLIGLFFIGCISDSQQEGLDHVGAFYNATTSYSKSFKTSTGEGSKNIFSIKVSNSQMIDSLNEVVTSPNIALMLFDNFTEKEKKAYTYVDVELIKNNSDTISMQYSPKALALALDQLSIYNDFSDKLVSKDYKGIVNMIEPKYVIKDLDSLIENYINILTNKHGKITSYMRTGFGVVNLKNGEKLLRYIGYLKFGDGYYRSYFINVPTQVDNDYIQGYDLK
jgi:hypothetical protein